MSETTVKPVGRRGPGFGGKPGPGRPKGSILTKTDKAKLMLENVRKVAMPHIDPAIANMNAVEIMMTAAYLEAQAGHWYKAGDMASKAAPYLHSRLQTVQLNATVSNTPREMSSSDIEAILTSFVEVDPDETDKS